jgi:hypothetical protein
MTGPVYHLFIVHGYREAYYQLSDDGRKKFWANIDENNKAVGAKSLVVCNSRWCDESALAWGVEELADLQAVQKSARGNEENEHFRYMDAETYLGLKVASMPLGTVSFPDPLYQLILIKNQNNDLFYGRSKAERDQYIAKIMELTQKNGGVMLIMCDTDWSNEEITNFGVVAWPNLEAELAYFNDLAEISFHRYFYLRTLLGTALA